jgi:beta-1,4-mannosyl-glycoprotein beta-1,4-N-acetylglucosaminyltransferase
MRVFDCFTFFNELDLLEFRLRFLNDFVDYFVIAESNVTFNGKNKPYNYEAAKEKFKVWHHKIIYIPVKQSTEGQVFENDKKYNPDSTAWKFENEQRNALISAATYMSDNDMVIVSDLDEIPDPHILKNMKIPVEPMAFSLLFHYYFFNCQNIGGQSRWWQGSIVSSGKQFKEITPQGLRNNRDIYKSIKRGGWHFSFLGGSEKIKYKIESYAHTEYNKEEYVNENHIATSIKEGKDILKREGVVFKYMPLSYYPARLQKFMKLFASFLHLKKTNFFTDLYYFIRRLTKGNI